MQKVKTRLLPAGWVSRAEGYDYSLETDESGDSCGSICLEAQDIQTHGSLKQRFSAVPFLGKRIRLLGLCRSENVEQTAGLFVRTERLDGRPLTSDNLLNRPLQGNADWQQYDLIIDVPAHASCIAIGAELRGRGQIWFKDLRIEEVVDGAPTTDQYSVGCA